MVRLKRIPFIQKVNQLADHIVRATLIGISVFTVASCGGGGGNSPTPETSVSTTANATATPASTAFTQTPSSAPVPAPGAAPAATQPQDSTIPAASPPILKWTITPLGAIYPTDINDAGQVIGKQGNKPVLYENGKITDLSSFFSSLYSAQPNRINKSGIIVGSLKQSMDGQPVAFVLSLKEGAKLIDPLPGAVGSEALDINDAAQIVGSYKYPSGATATAGSGSEIDKAFFYTKDTGARLLDASLPNCTKAVAINNRGDIAVRQADYDTVCHNGRTKSLLYSNGLGKDLAPQGTKAFNASFPYTNAYRINNSDQITGWLQDSSGEYEQAFQFKDNGLMPIGPSPNAPVPSGYRIYGMGINEAAQIVGYNNLTGDNRFFHPFLFSNGQTLDLNDIPEIKASDWVLNYGNAINNKGQIVGYGTLRGVATGFLLTPPSPP